jgi:hypothetical protein
VSVFIILPQDFPISNPFLGNPTGNIRLSQISLQLFRVIGIVQRRFPGDPPGPVQAVDGHGFIVTVGGIDPQQGHFKQLSLGIGSAAEPKGLVHPPQARSMPSLRC